MLSIDSIVQRNSDIIAAEADKDLVMVSITDGLYYGVSDVGRDIWEALEQPKRVADIIDDLLARYHVNRTLCEEETFSFLETLLRERLLQVRHEPSSQ